MKQKKLKKLKLKVKKILIPLDDSEPKKKLKKKLLKGQVEKKPLKKLKLKRKLLTGKNTKIDRCASCGEEHVVGKEAKRSICRNCINKGISFKDVED